MDKFNTEIFRDRYGHWQGKTTIKLGNSQELLISTYKNNRGALATYASVGTLDRGFVTHKLYQDYSKCFAADAVRCTEKNVQRQHETVLGKINYILDDITRHYNKEPALLA